MPLKDFRGGTRTPDGPAPTDGGGGRFRRLGGTTTRTSGGGIDPTAASVAGGAATLGIAALAAKFLPGRLGKAAKMVNALRMQLMLSGLAPAKSGLGNVGAVVNASLERGSLAPIRELLKKRTLQDAARSFQKPSAAIAGTTGQAGELPRFLSLPGRTMGALDDATRAALTRAGLSESQATREVLQTPLGQNFGKLGEALEGPAGKILVPFRRTPFNQFFEGFRAMDVANRTPGELRALAAQSGVGAITGAATADDARPLAVPLNVAAAGRFGVPVALAALMGRTAAGGRGGGDIAGQVTPVSDFGITQSIQDPLRPFRKPAAISALERVGLR